MVVRHLLAKKRRKKKGQKKSKRTHILHNLHIRETPACTSRAVQRFVACTLPSPANVLGNYLSLLMELACVLLFELILPL